MQPFPAAGGIMDREPQRAGQNDSHSKEELSYVKVYFRIHQGHTL